HSPPRCGLAVPGFRRDLHSCPTRRSSDLEADGRTDHVEPGAPAAATGRSAAGEAAGREGGSGGDGTAGPRDAAAAPGERRDAEGDRKSTRLNSSHVEISHAVFCLQKKKET